MVACPKCKATLAEVPERLDVGIITSLVCRKCGETTAFRSPLPMSESDMLHELGGDASLVAIEAAPPADAMLPALTTLPCLQITDFAVVDATGTPVPLHWLGTLLGGPGVKSAPEEAAKYLGSTTAGEGGVVRLLGSADSPLVPLLIGKKGKVPKLPRERAVKQPRERKQRAEGPRKRTRPSEPKAPRAPMHKKAATGGGDGGSSGAAANTAEESSGEEGEEEESSSSDDEPETLNWAQCDRCEKWRRLPDGEEYSSEQLPEKWYCEMNPNSQRSEPHPRTTPPPSPLLFILTSYHARTKGDGLDQLRANFVLCRCRCRAQLGPGPTFNREKRE